jgi:hypothetical protein
MNTWMSGMSSIMPTPMPALMMPMAKPTRSRNSRCTYTRPGTQPAAATPSAVSTPKARYSSSGEPMKLSATSAIPISAPPPAITRSGLKRAHSAPISGLTPPCTSVNTEKAPASTERLQPNSPSSATRMTL